MLCQIEIKNYRCFSDAAPAVFTLEDGLTAFVGPNNSGKSSVLRMFYELRNLWSALGGPQGLGNAIRGPHVNIGAIQGADDPPEIFFDSNSRPIEIKLTFPSESTSPVAIKHVLLQCERGNPVLWSVGVVLNNDPTIHRQNGNFGWNGAHILFAGNFVDASAACKSFVMLSNALYIPAFRNAINQGGANYYDLVNGTAFIGLWRNWKTGKAKKSMAEIRTITKDIQHIFEFAELEISPSEDGQHLILDINSKSYKGYEVGAGILQFIIVLANAAIRRPDLILIDEPELNLHASLQVDFLTSLASYAGRSVVYSTHSIGLARSTARQIYSTKLSGDHSVLSTLESTSKPSEFLGEMSFSAYRELGFDNILLVEGTTDLITIQQFLRMLKKDHKVVMIPVGGDRYVSEPGRQALEELKRISTKVYALFDSEKTSQSGKPKAAHEKLASICTELGFSVCLTERRALENYFTKEAVVATFGPNYTELGPYERLEDRRTKWPKSMNWKIARAMKWADIAYTDIGKFLVNI